MNPAEYKRHYADFLLAMFRAEVITFYADSAIPTVAVNQPESEKHKLAFMVGFSRRTLAHINLGYRSDDFIIENFGGMAFDTRKEELIGYHELPIALAHFEAFLGHSLVALWENDRSLLSSVGGYERHLKKMNLSPNPADWNQVELEGLMDNLAFEVFRSSFSGFCDYIKPIYNPPSSGVKILQLAYLERNVIIHNGGIINDRFLQRVTDNGLGDRGFVKGQSIPMDNHYIVTVSDEARRFAEGLFVTISQDALGIDTPLDDRELGYSRQPLDQQVNPAQEAVERAFRKSGGLRGNLR